MNILELIKERITYVDGGFGSLLQEEGLRPGEFPGVWNLTHGDVIVDIHKAYLEAGADILTTNTFGVDGLKFHKEAEFQVEEIVSAAIGHIKSAMKETKKKGYIALDIGPTGKLLKPLGDLPFEQAYQLFAEVVEVGTREGADLILIETMSDSYEVKAAVLAAKEHSDLPVFVTVTFDERGKLLTGGDISSVVALLEGLGVDAIGINCGLGPVQMKKLLKEMVAVASVPVIANPNAGLPRSEKGKTVYDIDADQFAETMEEIVSLGVSVVGGCCGTTPEHIEKTVVRTKQIPAHMIEPKYRTVISSFAKSVVVEESPIIIGERINPTGKSKFKQALRDHNLSYILQEGVMQQEHGAHVLDVNVGLPEIDEPAMMEEVIQELQSIIDLPLQIDTSNIEAMERAMRIYNGKPLINSVNGKQESMESVFPLVKKYGGVVVALLLDESGIPETAQGRMEIAKKIYKTAKSYGIQQQDIIIDALCLTVSADSKGALVTLETLRRVKEELQGKTILGVSNISFGLPQRELINTTFFTMAMQNGLNAAIINPNSERMMNAYYSFRVLFDLDAQCEDYIGQYSGQVAIKTNTTTQVTLRESIEKGLKEQAVIAVKALLQEKDSLEIINTEMIPALDQVGKGFEAGKVFLPQLLMSAEAAKGAFELIKDQMQKTGTVQAKKGKIILATVKGDIHDIGKNIVKVLLENYGFEMIDLGKDVAPDVIVEQALLHQVSLVGLSALMTTTVPSMEETIQQLQKQMPEVNVMVGGAVLTEDYAKSIGANRYCADAMASVYFAQEVYNCL